MTRDDGRSDDELRPITITRNWLDHAAGSVLIEFGRTRVLCAASASEGVPRWRKGSGLGWVTAEYAMLPASTNTRSDRESVKGRIGGRTHEISRLIGRSLRAVIDYQAMGENTIQLDCDVLQADGGTRTAAITGAYVALADACAHLERVRRADRLGGRGQRRHHRRGATPRPALRRGRARRDRHERRDDRRRQVRRGAGHGRGRGLRPGRARRPALAGREGLRRPHPAAAGGAVPVAEILLASRNAKKLAEMERILREHLPGVRGRPRRRAGVRRTGRGPADVRGQRAAQGAGRPAATGLPTLADDSGLCVDALNGMPGVLSARWSGPPKTDPRNNELLLAQLADVPDERRGAHFACAVASVHPDGRELVVEGRMHGPGDPGGAGERRLRLRRALRGRRPPRRDDGRAVGCRTRTRSRTAAGRCARSRLRWPVLLSGPDAPAG